MERVSYCAQGQCAASESGRVVRLHGEGEKMVDEAWRKDVQQMMLRVRRLAGFLKSRSLGLLIDQLEQAGYRIVAAPRMAAAAIGNEGDGRQFIEVARSCMREMEYQLLLAREANLPGRKMHEPMQDEFREIRRVLAKCIRRVRNR
ncbi:MAG: four helix bundle protein [Phycisphaerales bacterium]